ncbi:hypothetical protein L1049_000845 [Liquidambar formosana]|uniref:Uncharacterized protein n=1 Tax=Liquidambar formosana TaxID=63359 RepID=A0AAP0NBB6_LIQFO
MLHFLLLFIWEVSCLCYVALTLTGVFAGYIGSVSFLNTVLEVINKLRSINPRLTYGELFIECCKFLPFVIKLGSERLCFLPNYISSINLISIPLPHQSFLAYFHSGILCFSLGFCRHV